MKLILTSHARNRIRQRSIRLVKVRTTVEKPDFSKLLLKKKHLARKQFGKKTLEVVCEKRGQTVVVITAYYL